MNTAEPYQAILDTLEIYFQGLHQASSEQLARVFHPDARYVSAVADDHRILSFPEYRQVIDQRVAPADAGEPRQERVVSIELEGTAMAFVRLEMTMLGRRYTDFLTLIPHRGRWSIIAKIFHYYLEEKGV